LLKAAGDRVKNSRKFLTMGKNIKKSSLTLHPNVFVIAYPIDASIKTKVVLYPNS
jgi:hypothetical protein